MLLASSHPTSCSVQSCGRVWDVLLKHEEVVAGRGFLPLTSTTTMMIVIGEISCQGDSADGISKQNCTSTPTSRARAAWGHVVASCCLM